MTLRFFIGMALTVICIILGIQLVNWPETLRAFAAISVIPLVVSTIALLLAQVLFAMRWHGLIGVSSLPLFKVFRYMMIGCMANAIMPARPGGFIRIFLLKKGGKISLSLGLASTVIERLFDFIILCVLALGISLTISLPVSVTVALNFIGGASIGLIVTLVLLNRNAAWLPKQVQRYAILQGRVMSLIADRLMDFAVALNILRSPRKLFRCALVTIVGWSLLAASLYALSIGFHLPSPPVAVLLVLVATNLGAAIPSSPGALGVYHFMAVMALSVWNVDLSVALAFAICAHALTMAIHIFGGIFSVWAEKMQLSSISHLADEAATNDPLFAHGDGATSK